MQRIKTEYTETMKQWLDRMVTQTGKDAEAIAEEAEIPYKRFLRYKTGLKDINGVDFHNLCIVFFQKNREHCAAPERLTIAAEGLPQFDMKKDPEKIFRPPIRREEPEKEDPLFEALYQKIKRRLLKEICRKEESTGHE